MDYIYLGDKLTRNDLKNIECKAVRKPNGRCIRGRNSNMLVELSTGEIINVLARRLRKIIILE